LLEDEKQVNVINLFLFLHLYLFVKPVVGVFIDAPQMYRCPVFAQPL